MAPMPFSGEEKVCCDYFTTPPWSSLLSCKTWPGQRPHFFLIHKCWPNWLTKSKRTRNWKLFYSFCKMKTFFPFRIQQWLPFSYRHHGTLCIAHCIPLYFHILFSFIERYGHTVQFFPEDCRKETMLCWNVKKKTNLEKKTNAEWLFSPWQSSVAKCTQGITLLQRKGHGSLCWTTTSAAPIKEFREWAILRSNGKKWKKMGKKWKKMEKKWRKMGKNGEKMEKSGRKIEKRWKK